MSEPKWKRFERLIHQIHSRFGKDTVTLDEKLPGRDSKTLRQIDVVIRGRVNQYPILIIIECKDEARPIDVSTIDAFISVVRDVRANKGVIISTSGFTSAAIELARTHDISTRTYLDTENVDWKTEVTIPVLLTYAKIDNIRTQFAGVPGQPMLIPNIPPAFIEIFAQDGAPLGPMVVLLGKRWNHEPALHQPGDHSLVLAEDVLLQAGGGRYHTKISIQLEVREHHYLGPLSISLVGFRDEQESSISAQEFKTDIIDPNSIISGVVPGWREVLKEEGTRVECFLQIGMTEYLPETREELDQTKRSRG